MKTFAVIDSESTKVVDLIVADSKQTAESITGKTCVEYQHVIPGYTYQNGVFSSPEE